MNIRYLWDVDFLLFPTIYNMRLKSQFQKNTKVPTFGHFVKKGGFALLDMPSASIRDVRVVSLKEEKQVRFHSTYTASHEVIYLHLAV